MLCQAHPFYYGCTNVETYFPRGSFTYIDITEPDAAISKMMRAREQKTWENNRASLDEGRRRAIHDYNLMRNFARLAREAMAMDEAIEKPIRPWSFVPNGRCGRKKALVARLPDLSCAERYSSLIRKLSFGFPGSCVT
jgi:hypothetical protein